ncbi:MAG: hypothetical protein L3J58_11715 [Emcibacter sp.]|nr:hypothetical protein [Emcibacter sp.]
MTKPKAKSNAERQRDFKARRKAQGLGEVPEFGVWLDHSQWLKLRAYARQLAGKDKAGN